MPSAPPAPSAGRCTAFPCCSRTTSPPATRCTRLPAPMRSRTGRRTAMPSSCSSCARRRHHPRQGQSLRVGRLPGPLHAQRLYRPRRPDPQPLWPLRHAGFQLRLRRLRRRQAGHRHRRHGNRRLAGAAGALQRRGRHAPQPGADQPRPRHPAQPRPGHPWTDGPLCHRRRPAAHGHGRSGRQRPQDGRCDVVGRR